MRNEFVKHVDWLGNNSEIASRVYKNISELEGISNQRLTCLNLTFRSRDNHRNALSYAHRDSFTTSASWPDKDTGSYELLKHLKHLEDLSKKNDSWRFIYRFSNAYFHKIIHRSMTESDYNFFINLTPEKLAELSKEDWLKDIKRCEKKRSKAR